MKKLFKTIILTAFVCLLTGIGFAGTTAFAAEIVPEEDFDYNWYVTQHPELTLLGFDNEQVYQFYVNIGEPNGWHGRQTMYSWITRRDFDAASYALYNPDVVAYYETDDALTMWEHFRDYGRYEGRYATSLSRETNAAMLAYTVVDNLITPGMDERTKVLRIHDWLCANVAYDYGNYLSDTIPYDSYYYAGVFFNRRAVCNGYAVSFDLMCYLAGVESEYVSGYSTNSSGSTGGHAWNQVKVNGQWYQIDVTWDDPVPDRGYGVVSRYTYFLISPQQMSRNHTYDHPERIHY